tara:strand:+ start:141 stop:674 length:534 start_codon:yes stop_codon:yes gene_type:complete
MLIFKSRDGVEVCFGDHEAYQCEILREMYYPDKEVLTTGERKFSEKVSISIEDGEILQLFYKISYIIEKNKYTVDAIKNIDHIKYFSLELYEILSNLKDGVRFKILNLANFLQNNYVIELIKKSISSTINDSSNDEIENIYDLSTKDFTEEEYNQIKSFDNFVYHFNNDETFSSDSE